MIDNHRLEGVTHVIFDLDGTLYDKSRLGFHLALSQLPHLGLLRRERRRRKELRGTWAGSSEAFYELFFEDDARFRKWYFDKYMPAMCRVLQKRYSLRPEMADLLETLESQGMTIAVLSDYGCACEKLRAIGFDPARATGGVYAAPETGGLKPAREVFEYVLGQMGAARESTLVIGDRDDTDGEGARRASLSYLDVSSFSL